MRVFAGIDGGGTSTSIALLAVEGGSDAWHVRLLGQGQGASGNLHDVGEQALAAHIRAGWEAAWTAAGLKPARAAAVFAGMASVVTASDRDTVRGILTTLDLAPQSDVDHDLRISLAGALGGGPGIVVIAGTGSSCFGRAAGGATWMAGGWGSVLDDRGSSFDLGRGALAACARAADRRGPATALSDALAARFSITDWRQLLRLVDAGGLHRAAIAGLAPLVTAAADDGDAVARRLITEGAAELAHCVATVAGQIGLETPDVAATGGLASGSARWQQEFAAAVAAVLPTARIRTPLFQPVLGAAWLASQLAGVDLPADALHDLRG